MNILLVLEANSISYMVIRQLVSIFEGYAERTENKTPAEATVVTPIILNSDNDYIASKIEQVLKDYISISRDLHHYGYCGVALAQPQKYRVEQCNFEDLNDATEMLVETNSSLHKAYSYSKALDSYASKQYDKVITFVLANDSSFANLPLAISTQSIFNEQEACVVCQCQGEVTDGVREIGSLVNQKMVVTGVLENAHLYKGFSAMQTATALFKAIIDTFEMPVIANARMAIGAKNYTDKSIFYPLCTQALFRTATIGYFVESLEVGALNKMQKRIGLTDRVWEYSSIKKAFEKIAENFNNWQVEALGYDSGIEEDAKAQILKYLNDISKLPNTASAENKINELLNRMGGCDNLYRGSNEIEPLSNESLRTEIKARFVDKYSPTSLFELCESVFTQPNNAQTKDIRSAILDCWQYFYSKFPDNFSNKQSVNEIKRILSLTDVGRIIIEDDWVYSGTIDEIRWITSPSTGFAVSLSDSYQSGMELKDRPNDFRKFMICYIYLFADQFSEAFRLYVTESAKGVIDMTTLNQTSLFTLFEQFKNFKINISK